MKQLLGGSAADGGLGAAELRQKLAAAEREAARANEALSEAEAKVSTSSPAHAPVAHAQAHTTSGAVVMQDPAQYQSVHVQNAQTHAHGGCMYVLFQAGVRAAGFLSKSSA